ncbi:ATP-binding protein [Leptospira langatensis]|uniref:ATP-binding protein n=1 Tax=Leptospira langatensis TaxID=2484983 RepID=A0ABY2MDB6_9LEPT|nr:AAA family ATPase [Leptospira langatensis]TGL39669.1 ATP-binding protein [Leptospira langatensis]
MSCGTCKNTKRVFGYSDGRHFISEEQYKEFFPETNATARMLEDIADKEFFDKLRSGNWNKSDFGNAMMKLLSIPKDHPAIKAYKEAHRKENEINSMWVSKFESCPDCVTDPMEPYYLQSKEQPVTQKLFEELSKTGKVHSKIVALAKEGGIRSCFLIGPSRKGKTLFLKFLYNKLVKKNQSTQGLKFITGDQIRIETENSETYPQFKRSLDSVKYLFTDEIYAFRNMRDAGEKTDRHIAGSAFRNLRDLIEYLNERSESLFLIGASNDDPWELLPELTEKEADPFLKRIQEAYKMIIRIT